MKTDTQSITYNQIWKPIPVQPDQTVNIDIGSLKLWIHRGAQEWHTAYEHQPEMECRNVAITYKEEKALSEHDWIRWIVSENVDAIQLHPQLPDRPLVVRPEMPVCVMPKQSVLFFVGIPIWLSVSFGSRQKAVTLIPTMQLSNSWFGSTTEGELCYALKTTAKLHQKNLLPQAHRAIFPLEIRNTSSEKLNFERLGLQMQNLNIYQGDERMWTNRGRVTYRGVEKWSRVAYARTAPEFDQAKKLLGQAREPQSRGGFLKTFDNLKQLADF